MAPDSIPPSLRGFDIPEVGGPLPTPGPLYTTQQAPWEIPPPGSTRFAAQSRATVIGNNAVVVTQNLARLEIPVGMKGIIRTLNYRINDLVITSSVSFMLRYQQGVVPGSLLEVHPKNVAHDLIEFSEFTTYFHTPVGPAEIDVLFRVEIGDLATYLVSAYYAGWFYAEELYNNYIAQGREL